MSNAITKELPIACARTQLPRSFERKISAKKQAGRRTPNLISRQLANPDTLVAPIVDYIRFKKYRLTRPGPIEFQSFTGANFTGANIARAHTIASQGTSYNIFLFGTSGTSV